MTQAKSHEWANGVKALSMVLAVLLWLSVLMERPGELKLTVPVRVEEIPAGLWLSSPPPADVEVTISGPQILLLRLPLSGVSCVVDASGLAPGQVNVIPREGNFHLDKELKVVSLVPAGIPLVLTKK